MFAIGVASHLGRMCFLWVAAVTVCSAPGKAVQDGGLSRRLFDNFLRALLGCNSANDQSQRLLEQFRNYT